MWNFKDLKDLKDPKVLKVLKVFKDPKVPVPSSTSAQPIPHSTFNIRHYKKGPGGIR